MSNDVSMRLSERVWRELVAYEPFPPGNPLPAAIRDQLRDAAAIVEERPARREMRVATFSVEQAQQLEVWLTAASVRSHGPAGIGVALSAVREGMRVAAAV
jgi:hypothetical protein